MVRRLRWVGWIYFWGGRVAVDEGERWWEVCEGVLGGENEKVRVVMYGRHFWVVSGEKGVARC